MTVSAVIFDWGGTLTPWHTIDPDEMWRAICAPHYDQARAAETAAVLRSAENDLWVIAQREQRSATLDELFTRAGVRPSPEFIEEYFRAWEQHTFTDPEAVGVLLELRRRGVKIGVLSNTLWPR